MVSLQRRRGIPVKVWKTVIRTDGRGNEHKLADLTATPEDATAWVYPQRSARAEVPGQQHINVVRIGVRADIPDLELWSRIEMQGKQWDVVTPPAYHHGTRHTRHYSIDLRERP